jgi:23S rRNA G2069 N7-methylase RlmK/C1962 C5-methylase RlmI
MKTLFILMLFFINTNANAAAPEHGFVNKSDSGTLQAWNADKNEWTDIDSFWNNFAKTNKAKSWGITDTYPNYGEVKEFDTLVIELKQGTCLMQFYHARWRRANDVQRWHDEFNEYSACPYVFD